MRHGPPSGYDTCPTESNHRPLKSMSQNTQRIKSRFKLQTANRLYEDNILYTAYNDTSMLFAPIKKSKQINKNPKPFQTQGLIYLQTNENKQLTFLCSIAGSSIMYYHDFGDDLTTFLYGIKIQTQQKYSAIQHVIAMVSHFMDAQEITLYYNVILAGHSLFGMHVPNKCIIFVDLSNITYNHNKPMYVSELHIIIRNIF